MEMKWQKNGVSIDERTAQATIIQQYARPVCVVVVGVDCDFKSYVFENFLNSVVKKGFHCTWLIDRVKTQQTTSLPQLEIQPNDIFYVDMYDDEARDVNVREKLVAALKRLDVTTVIGLFIDSFNERGEAIPNQMGFSGGMSYCEGTICGDLHRDPPKWSEFDVMLTVESE